MRLIAFLAGFLATLIMGIAAPRATMDDGAKSSLKLKIHVTEEAERADPVGSGLTL